MNRWRFVSIVLVAGACCLLLSACGEPRDEAEPPAEGEQPGQGDRQAQHGPAAGQALVYELEGASAEGADQDLAEQVARILRMRLDPKGLSPLEVRPLTHNRIEIRIPAPSPEAAALRRAYRQARQRLTAGEAPAPAALLQRLDAVLALHMTPSESEALHKQNRQQWEARKETFATALQELRQAHPARADDIDAAVQAYKAYAQKRQRISDPETVKRMVATAGVLEFRIAPQHPEIYPSRSLLGDRSEEYRAAVREFEEHGPQRARGRNAGLQWFPIHGGNERVGARLVTKEHQGRRYVLLFDEPDKTMLAPPPGEEGPGWSLSRAYPTADAMGRPAVGFEFDEAGGRRMADLTGRFENHPMAILLDDEVYSAPYIRATIRDRGIIEGSFTPREVNELVRLLQVGSLPARVNPEPVSQRSFGPATGPN